jgi:HSP20 family molecular chaperone IbpA
MFALDYAFEQPDESVVIKLPMPELTPDEISVVLENRVLTITYNKEHSVVRTWNIPDWADLQSVTAELSKGILVVSLVKPEKARKNRILVKSI